MYIQVSIKGPPMYYRIVKSAFSSSKDKKNMNGDCSLLKIISTELYLNQETNERNTLWCTVIYCDGVVQLECSDTAVQGDDEVLVTRVR